MAGGWGTPKRTPTPPPPPPKKVLTENAKRILREFAEAGFPQPGIKV